VNASRGAGNLSVNDSSSLLDGRTQVSDGSLSRAELGYKNMDKILADDKLSRSKKHNLFFISNILILIYR